MGIDRAQAKKETIIDRTVESVEKKSDRELSVSSTSGPIEADFNSCREFHVRLALNNRDANAIRAESGPLNEYG